MVKNHIAMLIEYLRSVRIKFNKICFFPETHKFIGDYHCSVLCKSIFIDINYIHVQLFYLRFVAVLSYIMDQNIFSRHKLAVQSDNYQIYNIL